MPPLQTITHRLKKYVAVLFVVLIACFGFVQAVHVHDTLAKQSSPASHCSLCVIAHSAAVVTAAGSLAPIVRSALLAVSDPQLRSQLQVASSFIRPPPPVR